MSATDETPDDDMVETEFGWVVRGEKPPYNLALGWMKMPEGHVYFHEENGWHRVKPPEKVPIEARY